MMSHLGVDAALVNFFCHPIPFPLPPFYFFLFRRIFWSKAAAAAEGEEIEEEEEEEEGIEKREKNHIERKNQ